MSLFHGTSAKEDFTVPDWSSFFSDSKTVAGKFVRHRREGGTPRILEFRVARRILKLALIETAEEYDALIEKLGRKLGYDPLSFPHSQIVCESGLEGWVIPHNYPEGADIMLCSPGRWLEFVRAEPYEGP